MNAYELVFTRAAAKEYEALDGTVRAMVNKGLAKLRTRPNEIGKPLSGSLSGCRELKFRSDGIRIVYRVRNGKIQIVDILAIGARDKGKVFHDAERRLGSL
ncbi:type II toxin-antitoxin system RelE/ParE family toxin [Adlercreutzia sp. ZJ473]|uniref:type II toxin-antitoxin system RelE family toxin n=1 Tax=Adlercreutzia sp. ZJ473 TaxID=2722822 RepID=UPI001552CB7B|nr:type II toxin-antitoxin system RelE/ParE family toxin [Adlercreutzia sp. ZJ473]